MGCFGICTEEVLVSPLTFAGVGKTVIAAFDYKRFYKENPGKTNKLLFVAHREEILKQSRDAFRVVLRDPNFGELFVGDNRPNDIKHLFVSIQTLNSQQFWAKLPPDFYDLLSFVQELVNILFHTK